MANHIVKTKEAHDFLALVPQLVGFTPENSVVLVAFRGNRTCGALRFNLPEANVPAKVQKRIATSLIGTLCKIPGVDALVPVVYTAASVSATRGLPHARFADSLAKRAELSGFLVRDALCVASNAWGSYLDPQCPVGGHPLSRIAGSFVHADVPEVVARGLGTVLTGTELPTIDLAAKERVAAQYRRLQKGFGTARNASALVSMIGEVVDPVELAEVALGWNTTALSAADAAALLYVVQGPGCRDQVMVQFAFGREAGAAAHAANLRYWELQRRTGLSMDDIVALELAAEAAGLEVHAPDDRAEGEAINDGAARRRGLLMADLMLGKTDDRPDLDRTDRAITLLKTVIAMAPRSARPAPLCMLAWLSWSLGSGSVAGLYVDTALAIDPGYNMALLLDTLLRSGHLPEWAFRVPLEDSDR
ncbi:DUF4192 family protein [Cryobacterium melibiosiphilum]|uniref:DUF4192 family protein n=1 Tax=Cryobacterium melibiosiphilum TaxID=995039 RepID=A0A3A5MPW9_9MICO|nr:DUF4192 family protein [Cryobacterium melibiosiphilum]RJT87544.1 DUF4192 family protein [Cryobacterium melibiosiphilum]